MFRTPIPDRPPAKGWWQSPWLLAALVLLAAVPLLTPAIPPLTDLPGHMGRYRVQLADPSSVLRTDYFGFQWAVIGNLGLDLLVMPLAPLIGLEPAVKLIVMLIPPLTVLGMLLVARAAHGGVPVTALLALPLAYGYPFQWGFVNYALSMALALNAFALWLWLGRRGKRPLRAMLFVPIGIAIWFCHSFGWGVLGLLAFASEYVRERAEGRGIIIAGWHAGLSVLPLTPPMLLMLAWRTGQVSGKTTDWFNWKAKWVYLYSILRNHDMRLDYANAILLWALALAGLFGIGFRANRILGLATLVTVITFVALPRIVIGSAYADMRFAPYMVAIAVLAVQPKFTARWALNGIAILAIGIFGGRIALSTVKFAEYDRLHAEQWAALDHVKPGSRIFAMIDLPCLSVWDSPRNDHIAAIGIVRRDSFVNGQWSMPGAQLLTIKHDIDGFSEDPTQILRPKRCSGRRTWRYPEIVGAVPRDKFDYVWLVDFAPARLPTDPNLLAGLQQVWRGRTGALYRMDGSAISASETPSGGDQRATQ